MKKKKQNENPEVDAELLRMYMMGAANPANTDKNTRLPDGDVVDLHMQPAEVKKGKLAESNILFYQLQQFEKALDTALASGKLEMRVIHGLGKGRLKQEIYKILEKHPHVKSYSNEYHPRYGFGSTVIHFY